MNRGLELAKKNVFIRDFTHHPDILKLPKKTKEAMFNAVQENNEYLEKAMRKIFEKGRNEGVLENRIKEERFRTIEAMIFGMMIAMNTPFSNWDRRTQIEDIYEAIVTLVNA